MKNKMPYLPLIAFGNCLFVVLMVILLAIQFVLFPKGFGFIWMFQVGLCILWAYVNFRFYKKNFKFDEVLNILNK